MLTTALIILAIAAPVIAGLLFILRRKHSFTLGGTDGEDTQNETEKFRYVDENVLFTVYRPKAIAPARWYTLLAFAHLSEKRPGAPPGTPEPADEVRLIAERFYGGRAREQVITQQQGAGSVPERQLLTFVPRVVGVEFNPEEQEVRWLKDVHHVAFEMRCAPESEGATLRGMLTVYAGAFILTDVPLAFRVDSVLAAASTTDELSSDPPVEPYDKIFASYSHKDAAIVEQFEEHVEALGHRYLRDVYSLRSGEMWSEALEKLIEEAQVFQLFWSRNSMQSKFVRQEWEHALSLRRPNFVRPVYWEDPFPKDEEVPPENLATIHFHKYGRSAAPESESEEAIAKKPAPSPPPRPRLWDTVRRSSNAARVVVTLSFVFLVYAIVTVPMVTRYIGNGNTNVNAPPVTPTVVPTATPVLTSEDTALKNKTEAALEKAGVTGVIVEVDGGEVTLKGEVPRAKVHDAERAAYEAGAKRVMNRLHPK